APAAGQRPASIPPAAAAPGRPLRALAKGHWPAGGIQALAFTPDGRLLASGSDDGVVQLWDMAGGILRRRFEAHGGGVSRLLFSRDGRWLVTAGEDATIALWDGGPVRRIATLALIPPA